MVSMIGYLQPFVGFLFEHLDKFCSLPIGWLCAWHIFCFCWLTMSRTETVVSRDFQEHNAAKMHIIIFAVKWKKNQTNGRNEAELTSNHRHCFLLLSLCFITGLARSVQILQRPAPGTFCRYFFWYIHFSLLYIQIDDNQSIVCLCV